MKSGPDPNPRIEMPCSVFPLPGGAWYVSQIFRLDGAATLGPGWGFFYDTRFVVPIISHRLR